MSKAPAEITYTKVPHRLGGYIYGARCNRCNQELSRSRRKGDRDVFAKAHVQRWH